MNSLNGINMGDIRFVMFSCEAWFLNSHMHMRVLGPDEPILVLGTCVVGGVCYYEVLTGRGLGHVSSSSLLLGTSKHPDIEPT